jgi:hypothetical protein
MSQVRNVCSRRSSARPTMRGPSVFCAAPAPDHARRSGPIRIGLGQPRLSTRTALSSTAATREVLSAWRSWRTAMESGAAAPSSTAPMPAHAASRLPTSSVRSSGLSHTAQPKDHSSWMSIEKSFSCSDHQLPAPPPTGNVHGGATAEPSAGSPRWRVLLLPGGQRESPSSG